MRIRRYHLRDAQVSLRQFSERCRGLLFTAATAAAAGFLLFRLAAAAITLGHAGGSFIRRRLFIRNLRNHLRQFELFLFRQLRSFGLVKSIPVERTAYNQEQKREARDDPGQDVTRIRRLRAHYCGAAIAAQPRSKDAEQSHEANDRDDNHRPREGPPAPLLSSRKIAPTRATIATRPSPIAIIMSRLAKNPPSHFSVALERTFRETKRIAFEFRPGQLIVVRDVGDFFCQPGNQSAIFQDGQMIFADQFVLGSCCPLSVAATVFITGDAAAVTTGGATGTGAVETGIGGGTTTGETGTGGTTMGFSGSAVSDIG